MNNHCRFYDSDFDKMYSVQKKNEPYEAEKERGKLKMMKRELTVDQMEAVVGEYYGVGSNMLNGSNKGLDELEQDFSSFYSWAICKIVNHIIENLSAAIFLVKANAMGRNNRKESVDK